MKKSITWTTLYFLLGTCIVSLFAHTTFAEHFYDPKSISEVETSEIFQMSPSDGLLIQPMRDVSNPSLDIGNLLPPYEGNYLAYYRKLDLEGGTTDQEQNSAIGLATDQVLNQAQEAQYGNLTYGDRTRPIRMFRPVSSDAQYKVSVSFRAPTSGELSQVLLFWIYRSPHYAQGDGGRYLFELHPDDGTSAHAPGEEVLSSVGPLDFPFRDTWAWWPVPLSANLVEGNWYHVIFWNVHPSPEENYASYEYLSHEQGSVPQDLNWRIWTKKYDDSSPWVPNDEFSSENYGGMEASIILQWENKSFWGQGYISALADPPRPKIYGNYLAGEFFVADQDRIVNRISIRLSRIGTPKDDLYIKLENENGEPIFEKMLVTASELPQFDPYDGQSKEFITMQIEPAVQLKKDSSYRLIFSSPSSDSEENSFVLGCPVYSSTNVYGDLQIPSMILTWQGSDQGYIITSMDGGSSWDSDPNADVSFYFSSNTPINYAEDINRDGNVDAIDLQICVYVYSGEEADPVIVERADVNGDGVVNQSDIVQIVGKILGG